MKMAFNIDELRKKVNLSLQRSISEQQADSQRTRANRDKDVIINPVVYQHPAENNILQLLANAIKELSDGQTTESLVLNYTNIGGEWIVPHSDSSLSEPLDRPKSGRDAVILYMHGGAFLTGSPAASRAITCKLVKLTGTRCLSIGYRLSPQHPFPAALVDTVVAYLTLIMQLSEAAASDVTSPRVILAGESAGMNLCLTLVQVLLDLQRQQRTTLPMVRFHGRLLRIPLPVGVTGISGACDCALSLPSWTNNSVFDIFQGDPRYMDPNFKSCDIWPSSPPRAHVYVEDDDMLAHPLVSPACAENWAGSPPLWVGIGEEGFADSNLVVARAAASQGVPVRFIQWMQMPHCFPLYAPGLPQSIECMNRWSHACLEMIQNQDRQTIASRMSETGVETNYDISKITPLSPRDVMKAIRKVIPTKKPFIGKSAKLSRI